MASGKPEEGTMTERWVPRRVLILGSTYPSYSRTHREVACTGGLLEDGRLVRLHPIPRRHLEGEQSFKAWQWIHVDMCRYEKDPRPESYRIRVETLHAKETVTDDEERRHLLRHSRFLFPSVENLLARQTVEGTSLGIVMPREIRNVRLGHKGAQKEEEWRAREAEVRSQPDLFEGTPWKIDYVPRTFEVSFVCDEEGCLGHTMQLQDWGIHELYRKHKGVADAEAKVVARMEQRLDLERGEVYLYLGNFRGHLTTFGLMGAFNCRSRQGLLAFE
jgi:hypothetical protein